MKSLKTAIATLAAILAVNVMSAQVTVAQVNAKFNEAAALLNAQKTSEALPVLEEVIKMGMEAGGDAVETVQQAQKLLATCHYSKGLSLAKGRNLEGALVEFNAANQTGELYGDISTARKAKQMISKVYTMMGAEAFNNKDYAKAADVFAQGYEVNPSDTKLALNLAVSYCEMGDKVKGYAIYKDVMALESRHSKYAEPAAEARTKLAEYLLLDASDVAKAGVKDSTYTAIEKVLELDPKNAAAHIMRIQTATNAQDWTKVIEWGESAAAAQATAEAKSDAYFYLGAAYQNTENKAKAIETYAKVVAGNNVAEAKNQSTLLKK